MAGKLVRKRVLRLVMRGFAARTITPTEEQLQEFESFINMDSGSECWLWTGKFTKGTPVMDVITDGRKLRASALRICFSYFVRPLEDQETMRRTCPNRECINPDHMEVAYRADTCIHGHPKRPGKSCYTCTDIKKAERRNRWASEAAAYWEAG